MEVEAEADVFVVAEERAFLCRAELLDAVHNGSVKIGAGATVLSYLIFLTL